MSNATSESAHWLDRGPGEGVVESSELANMIVFIFFVVAGLFFFFGRRAYKNWKYRGDHGEGGIPDDISVASGEWTPRREDADNP